MTVATWAGNTAALVRDGLLALGVLAGVLVAGLTTGATIAPLGVLLGSGATVGFELAASRRAGAVRAVWERTAVQAASVLLTVGLVTAAAVLAPNRGLSAIGGAVGTYLLYLLAVTTGVLSRPGDDTPE